MKIVMLGKYTTEPDVGGVAVHIVNMIESIGKLDNKEFDFHMISFGEKNNHFCKGNSKVTIYKTPKIYFILPILSILKLHSEIQKINPDIIHVQGSNISPYLVYLLSFLPNATKIITVHGLISIESEYKTHTKRKLLKYLNSKFENSALNRIQNLIVCSPEMKKLVSMLTLSDVHIIPNGIDTKYVQQFHPRIDVKQKSIFFIGTLRKVKGVHLLLSAMPAILKSIGNIHLYIAGTGEQEHELKALTSNLNLAEHVTFLGSISNETKYSYYKSADISVFPSLYEPFGIVLLEAMACGTPIIASNVGGIPYVIKNRKNGLLFEPNNIEDLAAKIIYLLENKNIQHEMKINGLKRAEQFEWRKVAEITTELYKKINIK